MAATCPAGHSSTTTDYCDTCGAPIGAPAAGGTAPGEAATTGEAPAGGGAAPSETEAPAAAPAAAEAPAGTPCPGCGEPVGAARFCESCGYDLESGTPAGPAPVTLVLGADRAHWDRMVGSGEPAFPGASPTLSLELTGDRAMLGRVRAGADPAGVDLVLTGSAADPAISHHQCIFERDGATWTVRDAGSANGTWINDATDPLADGAAHPLAPGDRILMGAWTSLTVRTGATPGAAPAAPGEGTGQGNGQGNGQGSGTAPT